MRDGAPGGKVRQGFQCVKLAIILLFCNLPGLERGFPSEPGRLSFTLVAGGIVVVVGAGAQAADGCPRRPTRTAPGGHISATRASSMPFPCPCTPPTHRSIIIKSINRFIAVSVFLMPCQLIEPKTRKMDIVVLQRLIDSSFQ